MALRKYFGDRLTGRVLFYKHVSPDAASVHNGQDQFKVLSVRSADVDRYVGASHVDDPTIDSVLRYLQEWFPSKKEFKEHMRDYVKALVKIPPSNESTRMMANTAYTDTTAATPDDRSCFTELQKIMNRIGHHFSDWRFYKSAIDDSDTHALSSGEERHVHASPPHFVPGMIILRCDDASLCGCVACIQSSTNGSCSDHSSSSSAMAGGVFAHFHFWGGGVSTCTNPRDKRYSEASVYSSIPINTIPCSTFF